jgi:hypothetical protein
MLSVSLALKKKYNKWNEKTVNNLNNKIITPSFQSLSYRFTKCLTGKIKR